MEFTGERFVPELDGEIKYEHLHRYALALDFVEGRTVLDIASGEGYGSALLAKRAASVIGVDIDVESINHAQAQYSTVANLKFLAGSCDAIPVADASIEVVVSFETIEHHDQHEEMMQEIKRVLKPDGLLIISSPNKFVYSDEFQQANPFHVKELYYEELVDLLKHYFHQVYTYGQKLAVGSWVTALDSTLKSSVKAYSGSVNTLFSGVGALPAPVYFVALCSNRTEPLDSIASAYVDVSDDLWKQLQQERNANRLNLGQLQHQYNQLQHEYNQLQHQYNQLQHQCNQLQHEYNQLQYTSNQERYQLHEELDRLQQNNSDLQNNLQNASNLIEAMKSSKFWKLRQMWMQLKEFWH